MITALFAALAFAQSTGTITTVAGNGSPTYTGDGGSATNTGIGGGGQSLTVAVSPAGLLHIADQASGRVRRVSSSGAISTVADQLFPSGIAIDGSGNIYVANGSQVRRISTSGIVTTIAGTGVPGNSGDDGPATNARFTANSIASDAAGNLYITDSTANRVRKIRNGIITAFAGNGANGSSGDGGPAIFASIFLPQSVATDRSGNVYFADGNNRIRKVNASGNLSTVAGNGSPLGTGNNTQALSTGMTPSGIAVDGTGNIYYSDLGTHSVRRISTSGNVTTIAGTGLQGFTGDGGPASSARLSSPRSLALDESGNLLVADTNNFRIRKIWGIAGPPGPTIDPNGVVNGASFLPGITPNGWASILGSNLSTATTTWDNAIVDDRLPTTLAGVSVTVDSKPAYIAYVSPTQVNFLVPDVGVGSKSVVLTSASGARATFSVNSRQYDPAFFVWPGNQPVATRQDFSPVTTAKPGEVIILWGAGFSPTIPPVITVDGISATVYGAALAPGFVGLYQIAIEVPPSLPDGNWTITATIGDVTSPSSVQLTVRR